MHSVLFELLVIAVLIALNGVFAMAELALVSARKTRLQALANAGNRRARVALDLAAHPTRFLSTVQIGVTLSSVAAGAFSGAALAGQLNAWMLAHHPDWAEYSAAFSFGLVVLGITFSSIILGELVPKRLALARPEEWALALAYPMAFVSRAAAPFVWLLSRCTEAITRILGTRSDHSAPVTDDEVAALLEQGRLAGVFHRAEQAMVAGVMGLDRCPVTRLMAPRPKIVFLDLDDGDEANWRKVVASGHSHFPVCRSRRDHVVGMVSIKAMWAQAAFGLPVRLGDLLTPALHVPETATAIQVLELFKQTGKHVALVVDEFGSTRGLVTLIDIMEAIVGDLPDQLQKARAEARQRADGSWLVDGTLDTTELKKLLGVSLLPDEAGFQTLAGFVVSQLGRIPAAGDAFSHAGWRFEVMDMDGQRVDKVLLHRESTGP
jgi:putative hemolysin